MERPNIIRKPNPDVSYTDYGKLPPQVKELEEAVLGAIMIESEAINTATAILKSENFFYVDAHQRIFKAIKSLYKANNPIDLLTVTTQLTKNGDLDACGGPFYIAQLTNKVGSAASIEYHSQLIAEKYLARQIIQTASEAIKDAYEDQTDVFDLLGLVSKNFDALNAEMGYSGTNSFADGVENVVLETENAAADHTYTVGLKSEVAEIDRISGGFKKGNVIIVAARPGMGKTALALQIARKQAKKGKKVGIFSLEMAMMELIQRMVCSETIIDFGRLQRGNMKTEEWGRFKEITQAMKELPIYIEDRVVGISQIKSIARIWKQKHGIEEIIIDYIQLIPGEDGKRGQNREQELSSISRQIKLLAKELEIPIIVLSQLSRECEKRKPPRPILSDLRESGAIEQDADIVITLFREAYYTQSEDMTTEFDFLKNRNGKTGTVKNVFDGAHQRFIDCGAASDIALEQEMAGKGFTKIEKEQEELPF